MKGFILNNNTTNIDVNPAYVSPNLVKDYSTILEFMSAENPEALELITEPLDFIEEDTPQLVELSEKHGLPIITVTACPYMRDKGIEYDKAFSKMLMQMALT